MRGIVWLASYPKSGNTWFRAFLANFQSPGDQPAEINHLNVGGIACDRDLFDSTLGIESSDLTPEEIDRYRPALYRAIAAEQRSTPFMKIHDAYLCTDLAQPLVPEDATQAAIYIVRNPLDVAISFAHHSSIPIDHAIEQMADENFAFSAQADRLPRHLRQRLSSWSGHVRSWRDQGAIRVHLVRYEDLRLNPSGTFARALSFLGISFEESRLRRAVEFSSFEVLRSQEIASGFREKPAKAAAFFRSGRSGQWREVLTPEQAARIVSAHGPTMRELGYLQ